MNLLRVFFNRKYVSQTEWNFDCFGHLSSYGNQYLDSCNLYSTEITGKVLLRPTFGAVSQLTLGKREGLGGTYMRAIPSTYIQS